MVKLNKIQKKILKRILISIIFMLVGIILKNIYEFYNFIIFFYLSIISFLISYYIIVKKIFKKAINNIKNFNIFDENFLMLVASMGAFIINENIEAIMIIIFYEIGELLQKIAVENSRTKINEAINIRADYVNLKLKDGSIVIKDPKEIKIGDVIIVKKGEKIALDSIVLNGNSVLDTSSITGESMTNIVKKGDEVYSGFINLDSVLELEVISDYYNSTASKILNLIENASLKKSKTEKFITKFSKVYTPIVVIISLFIAIIPPVIFDESFKIWSYRALSILVISCPCALVISVPLSFFSSIGTLSKLGILVKGGNYIEILSKIDMVLFDKTGTLTDGLFTISDIEISDNNIKLKSLIEIIYAAEYYSTHIIGKSIRNFCEKEYEIKINYNDIDKFEEIIGYGVKLNYKNKELIVGNKKLMEKYNVNLEYENDYLNNIYILYDSKLLGKVKLLDKIKENTIDTIKNLKKIGIKKTIMLTGDRENISNYISKKLGIDECYSKLLPMDKIEILERKIKENKKGKVMYVGDGINDILSITRADVGVAMGKLGSNAILDAADVIIMNDEINKILDAIKVSKNTIFIAKQNIYFALVIKFLIFISSIFFGIDIWFSIFADVGVTLLTIINSLRIFNTNKYEI